MYRDTPEGHSWLSVIKICRMMCPKCTRRNSMLPTSFKREKRWQNADMEMNSFSIARIPMPRRQEYKKKCFSSPGHQYKMQIGNQTFFPLPEYQYNADRNTKTFFISRTPI
jgi:hypothetical protein